MNQIHADFANFFYSADSSPRHSRCYTNIDLAQAGGGLALGHDTIAGRLIADGALTAPFGHRAPMQEAYYLILSPQAERAPGAVAFSNWLRHELAA